MDFDVLTVPENDLRVTRTEAIPRWSMRSRLMLGLWTFSMPFAALALAIYTLVVTPHVPPVLIGGVYYLIINHFILTVFYLSFAAQNPRLSNKVAWMIALVLAGPVSILVYWLIYVWHAPKVGPNRVDTVIPRVMRAAHPIASPHRHHTTRPAPAM